MLIHLLLVLYCRGGPLQFVGHLLKSSKGKFLPVPPVKRLNFLVIECRPVQSAYEEPDLQSILIGYSSHATTPKTWFRYVILAGF